MIHKFEITCEDAAAPRLLSFLLHQSKQPDDRYTWAHEKIEEREAKPNRYNFNLDLSTENFTIEIDEGAFKGYFEHKQLGDECGGELWFDPLKELVDYDGVYELPKEVRDALKAAGFWGDGL